jgi:hypothetical protein
MGAPSEIHARTRDSMRGSYGAPRGMRPPSTPPSILTLRSTAVLRIARLHAEKGGILERRDTNHVAAVGGENQREAAGVVPVAGSLRTPGARRRKEERHTMGSGHVSRTERVPAPAAAERRTLADGVASGVGGGRLGSPRGPAGRGGKREYEEAGARWGGGRCARRHGLEVYTRRTCTRPEVRARCSPPRAPGET